MRSLFLMRGLQRFVVLFVLSVFLIACGGGSGSGGDANTNTPLSPPLQSTPVNPQLSVGFGLKELKFTWLPVSGAAYYRLLGNPDGASGYSQLGRDIPAQSTEAYVDIAVHRFNWINATFILQACDANRQCSDSNVVNTLSHLIEAIGYFKASNTGANDAFGFSIALAADGNTLAVGVPGEASNATGVNDPNQQNNSAAESGAVYVFVRSSSGWTQQAYIKASNTETGDWFGFATALSANGDTLVVSALSEDSDGSASSNNSAANSGAVYVYVRTDNHWTQQAYIKASNTETGDWFGFATALSANGDTLVVSALYEDSDGSASSNNSAAESGAVYVFVRSSGGWTQQAYIKASNTEAGDWFGHSVALSANGAVLAVGGSYEGSQASGVNGDNTDNTAPGAGAAYIFIKNGSNWIEQAYVKASNTQSGDRFGASLDLDDAGTTLAVAAFGEDGGSTGVGGDQSNNDATDSGAVYVFTYNNNVWAQQAYIKASNTQGYDNFGSSLTLSGNAQVLAVGALGEDSHATGVGGDGDNEGASASGAVYTFEYDGSIWNQQGYIKAANTGADDGFGAALGLSADGMTLAVGAGSEDGASSGVNKPFNDDQSNSGAVYLY